MEIDSPEAYVETETDVWAVKGRVTFDELGLISILADDGEADCSGL